MRFSIVRLSALVLVCSILSFGAGVLLSGRSDPDSRQARLGEGRLTNPLLECEVSGNSIAAEKINFGSELRKIVAESQNHLGIENIGVYFRDLNNGPTTGVNQDDPFIPASLLKVPIIMAYYKEAEKNGELLTTHLTVTEAATRAYNNQKIIAGAALQAGDTYSVATLLEKMIIDSDNAATVILSEYLPLQNQLHLYKLLGVDTTVITDPTASLSVKQYSAFFRILFNSSFLSQENSEKILEILSRSKYIKGLTSGVPESVLVAHKFGERKLSDELQQIHDCGIVYYPGHPYLLCIMTRGRDIADMEKAIKNISAFVYAQINAQCR